MKTIDAVTYDASAAIVLAEKAQNALTSASDFRIDSRAMFEIASEELRQVKTLQKEVDEKRTSITGPLNQAVKAVNDLFRSPKEYLDRAESSLKRSMNIWIAEQERIENQARIEAEAAARAEREHLVAIEREQKAAERKALEEAQAASDAGDMEAAAKAIEAARYAQQKAETAAMTANVVSIAPVEEATAKVSGISRTIRFSAEVTDIAELVKAVAAGEAPIEAIQADMKFLGAQARAFKKVGKIYPGVMAVAEGSISASAAR